MNDFFDTDKILNGIPNLSFYTGKDKALLYSSSVKEKVILFGLAGSHSYGTNNQESDIDCRGILILPYKVKVSPFIEFEQIEWKTEAKDIEGVFYELEKVIRLLSACNPNIIEMLFVDNKHIFIETEEAKLLRDNRNLFLSQKALNSFIGYADSQMKRIRLHKKYIDGEIKRPLTREELGLPESKGAAREQIAAAKQYVKEKKESLIPLLLELNNTQKQNLWDGVGRIFTSLCKEYGIEDINGQELWDVLDTSVARTIGFDDNFINYLKKEKVYDRRQKEYKNYLSWLKSRNPTRAALEKKYGYDCYSIDTEFLTEEGWKLYDQVQEGDTLATLDPDSGHIEYQPIKNRIRKHYSGVMYNIYPGNALITGGHNLLVSPGHRSRKNNFCVEYDEKKSRWHLASVNDLLSQKKSHYHIRVSASEKNIKYSIDDDYLLLAGAFISEGCVNKRDKCGRARSIRIEQKKEGDLTACMNLLMAGGKYNIKRYDINRIRVDSPEYKGYLWVISGDVCSKLEDDFGSGSYNKRLPSWALNMSTRQVNILLSTMIAGDGTKHGLGHTYYTVSKKLANDIQLLCLHSGIVCKICGPYTSKTDFADALTIYYVFISNLSPFKSIYIRKNSANIKEINYDDDVVCFEVEKYNTLITRRCGEISIHGNCKHAMHLVRLLNSGEQIIREGYLDVYRPERKLLIDIRNGGWTFEELLDWSTKKKAELFDIIATEETPLPIGPDFRKINDLYLEIIELFNNR